MDIKKSIVLGLLSVFGLMAFAQVQVEADDNIVLNEGETLTWEIKALDFTDEAIESGAFISWEMVGDWDKFDYAFSQGTVENNVYTIRADEYESFVEGTEGLAVDISGKPKIEKRVYNLSLKTKEVSKDLEFDKENADAELSFQYLPIPPMPWWLKLLIAGAILLVLVLLILLVLHVTAKFPRGLLQLGRDSVRLKGKKRISVKEELDKMGISVANDADVIFVKKRFASFQGPSIKEMKNCELERYGTPLSKGAVIHLEEEIKGVKDLNGNDIIIRYCY